MRALLVLSGPPGAGKTTVARLVANGYDRAVHLRGDDFWHYIAAGFVEPWLPESAPQNGVVMHAVASAAAPFVQGGYVTVVDAVVGPWLLEPFRDVARRSGFALDYVVLRPRPDVALQRATSRASGLRREAVVRHMSREFADLGELESHVVDSTTSTPEETARAVGQGLAALRFRIG